MTYRLRNILLAVVLAVLAAFLTALYVASYQNRVDSDHEKVKVLVAADDIAPGTPGASVAGRLEEREVLRKDVVPAALASKDQLNGQATAQWIYAGEQVTTRRFSLAGQGGIRAELKGNLRAFQLSGTEQQLLAGTLRAGDRIDLVANLKMSAQREIFATRVILRDLQVLRAPVDPGPASKLGTSSSNSGLSVVLAATDSQAQKLLFVTSRHIWSLQLRPTNDAVDSPESLTTLPSVLNDGLSRNPGSTGGN
jgi:Flp pilus assembly protein CpaB